MTLITPLRITADWEAIIKTPERKVVSAGLRASIGFLDEMLRAHGENEDIFPELCEAQRGCTEALAKLRKRSLSNGEFVPEDIQQSCAKIAGLIKNILILLDEPQLAAMLAVP